MKNIKKQKKTYKVLTNQTEILKNKKTLLKAC